MAGSAKQSERVALNRIDNDRLHDSKMADSFFDHHSLQHDHSRKEDLLTHAYVSLTGSCQVPPTLLLHVAATRVLLVEGASTTVAVVGHASQTFVCPLW